MVRGYVEELYEPTAAQTDRLSLDDFGPAQELAAWKARVVAAWDGVEVLSVETDVAVASLGADRIVDAEVSLGSLDASDVEVQLLHGPVGQGDQLEQPIVVPMSATGEGARANRRYRGAFTCARAGRYGFTVRVVPSHEFLTSPVELGRIAWA